MKVKINQRQYSMPKEQYRELREKAKEQIERGIYAIEKEGEAELRCDVCKSMSQLKRLKRCFKQQGYKVHYKT